MIVRPSPVLCKKVIHQIVFKVIVALRRGGGDRILLESPFRSHWPQAYSLNVSSGYNNFHNPLWPLPFLLGYPVQVPPSQTPPPPGCTTDLALVRHSRCLHGAMKGKIGVIKSTMAELVDEANMARGYSILMLTWSLGYVIGLGILSSMSCPGSYHVP